MNETSRHFLAEMQDKLTTYFSGEEIETAAFVLGIDYDTLRGGTKPTKVNALLVGLARNGRLPDLLDYVGRERGNVAWPELPPNFELPQGAAGSDMWGVTIQNIITGGGPNISGGTYNTGNMTQGGNITTTQESVGGDKVDGVKNVWAGDYRTAKDAQAYLNSQAQFLQQVNELKVALSSVPAERAKEAEALSRRVDMLAQELSAETVDSETVNDLVKVVQRAGDALTPTAPTIGRRVTSITELAVTIIK